MMPAVQRSWLPVAVLLLTGLHATSQPLFTTALGVTGATAQDLIVLPNGDLISAGHKNAQLQLVRWTAQGDTLWVIDHPIPIPLSTEERRQEIRLLTTGEVLVTTLNGSSLFDQDGTWLNSIDLRGTHVLELGVDSLLACTGDSLFLKDRTGNSIWQRAIIRPELSERRYTRVSSIPSGFLTLTSQVAGDLQGSGGSLQLGRYLKTGAFIDTLTIASSGISGELAGVFDLSRTADGGAVGTAVLSYTISIVRCNAEGDILWTRSFSPFDPLGEGLQPFWPSGETVELNNGDLLMSGHLSDNSGSSIPALAKLDFEGDLLCFEQFGILPGGSAAYRSALTQGADDVIYSLSGIDYPLAAMSATLRAFNDLCVTTSLQESPRTSTFPVSLVSVSPGSIIVDRSTCDKTIHYAVYGCSGRLLAEGSAQCGSLRIDLGDSASGLVFVRLDDGASGISEVFKLVLL